MVLLRQIIVRGFQDWAGKARWSMDLIGKVAQRRNPFTANLIMASMKAGVMVANTGPEIVLHIGEKLGYGRAS
jgi:hypothetical protein